MNDSFKREVVLYFGQCLEQNIFIYVQFSYVKQFCPSSTLIGKNRCSCIGLVLVVCYLVIVDQYRFHFF